MDKRSLYSEVGRNIRRAREGLMLTQEALACLVSLTRTSITNIEKGRQTITLHKFFERSEALRVTPSNLLPTNVTVHKVDLETELPVNLSKNEKDWIKSVISSSRTE